MTSLISIDQLNDRLGQTLAGDAETQAEAFIEDASELVLQIATGNGDAPAWDSPNDLPGAVVPVIVSMVRRAIENPRGLSGEQLGDYQWQAGQGGQASIYATRREERIIRRAAGRLGAGTVQLEGYLQAENAAGSLEYEDQLIDSLP